MPSRNIYLGWFITIAISGAYSFSANSSLAQITPDTTLPNNSIITPSGNINVITEGTQVGGNLFHSFQQFSVPTGSQAFFNNAVDIGNIISRVTGSSTSNIDGLIRANGTANLFLINPNGIVFGQNAQLNVGGSFVASTANAIQFGNGGIFSASNPEAPSPLLTINPSALLFNQIAASIQNNSVSPAGLDRSGLGVFGLRVPDGRSLLLVGGNVSMDGSGLYAFGGRVELGGVSGAGTVGLNFTGNNLSLSFPTSVQRADVSLSNAAKIDVTDRGQGSVALGARNLDISGGSRIDAGIGKGLTADNSPPGNITLNATGVVTVNQHSRVTNVVAADATGNAGDINIQAGEIIINNQARYPEQNNNPFLRAALDTSIQGQGRPGNISLEANGSITLIGQDVSQQDQVIAASNDISQQGAGNISLKANDSISLSNATVYAPSGTGDGGNILLVGNNSVSLANNTSLFTASTLGVNSGNIIVQSAGPVSFENSLLASTGDYGGDIKIGGRSVSVTAGTEVSARSFNGQKSGNIEINAPDYVEISGKSPAPRPLNDRSQSIIYSSLLTTSEQGTMGQSGDMKINTGILRVFDGAQLRAESAGGLRGGNITVNANVVELTGGGQLLTTAFSGGDAGDINLRVTDRITINGSNPSKVELFDQIAGSKIRVELLYAREIAQGDGRTQAKFVLGNDNPASGIFANTSVASTGKGGNVKIATGQLLVSDSAQVNVSTEGKGNAGNLDISARKINLDNQAKLTAETASGKGGNITLQNLDLLLMRRGSQISTTAGTALSGGDGGNITINAPKGFVVAVPNENSDITANAFTGIGGQIEINISGLFGIEPSSRLTSESDITAFSENGISGEIAINQPDVDQSLGFVELPVVLADTSELIADISCAAVASTDADTEKSKFTVTGRGGLPPNPYDSLTTDVIWTDNRVPNIATQQRRSEGSAAKPVSKAKAVEIVPATGWVFNGKGQVTLISHVSNANGIGTAPATCPKR
ncbi:filamentous hemagglutinin N-terminal domain-containing protein [Tolypothrix campylonemoides VB511288]|nr:filamentous hemagglutinin N-terminal domain-containing protein [Tolypothrix campylonemoides VB511288]